MKALVIGAGGLGGPAALGLAAAGVERVTILDDDRVDPTNLSRQMFFGEGSIGRMKCELIAGALQERFPETRVRAVVGRLSREDAEALVVEHDFVLDGSDNFPTRFLANDVCVAHRVPLVHGAALRWRGQVLAVVPGRTPCLRCLFEGEPPSGTAPTCAEAGVIAPLVGVVGAWMAEAALAIARRRLGRWEDAIRTIDAWHGRERFVPVGRDPACAVCGGR